MELETPIENISRIPASYKKRLEKLGVETVRDLLFHFPHRYEDFSNIIPIAEVGLDETVCVKGIILEIQNRRTWAKRMFITEAVIKDETGPIKVVWFNQPFLTRSLRSGDNVCLAGKVAINENGLYLSSPIHEKIGKNELVHTGRLVPVYPETEGVSSRWLRYILRPILAELRTKIPEVLPAAILKKEGFLPVSKAIWQIHFPDSSEEAKAARERFSFKELFLLELLVIREKARLQKNKSIPIILNLKTIQAFVKSLPFELTTAQKKVSWQILKDLEKPRPMSRLLQGDVGSGKTIVATMVALNVSRADFQTAFMVPTEILAQQHFQKVCQVLKNFETSIALLTGKEGKIFLPEWQEAVKVPKKEVLEKLEKGGIKILIGTHALIQEGVKFKNLALVILDEQHRFGVEQRAKLCKNAKLIPHLFSMTATPIPRSLALTVYGDLDLSVIDEMPKGRKKIITEIVSPEEREKTYEFIRKEIKKGRQVFVICPRIETPNGQRNSDWALVKAVKEEYKKLSEEIFPDLKVAMIHGRIKPEIKEKIMTDFKNKETNILVSTSVVEVGVDIPNASVMMIEDAERFGLAQLHQFRGRVGRSIHQSYCFLFAGSSVQLARQRLRALVECENGFELAEQDLKMRGAGDFIGTRQSGMPDLIMASLGNVKLIEKTRETAKEILAKDSGLKKYPLLKQRLEKFRIKLHLE